MRYNQNTYHYKGNIMSDCDDYGYLSNNKIEKAKSSEKPYSSKRSSSSSSSKSSDSSNRGDVDPVNLDEDSNISEEEITQKELQNRKLMWF